MKLTLQYFISQLFLWTLALADYYQGPSSRLTRFLTENHVRFAPPDGVVIVDYELELVHIVAVDELKQIMKVLVYVVQQWQDDSLKWNPSNYSGLNHTWLPVDAIWIPDIIVFNMLQHTDILHATRTPAKVESSGIVTFSYPAIYSVMCSIRIGNFPFDDQKCSLRIASWGYGEDKLVLNATCKGTLPHYSSNEEWALKGVHIEEIPYEHEGTVVSQVIYNISVGRKPLFYMITLVLPSYIICLLSVAGLFARFSTKNEREERFTLGVTAILTMAVLSLVVAEKVPHSSEEVPLLVVYFHFNIIMVTLATVCTSSVMRLHWKGLRETKYPPEGLLSALCIKRVRPAVEVLDEQPQALQTASELWGSVSRRCDYILLFTFLVAITVATMFMFVKNYQRLHQENQENRTVCHT